MKINVTRKAIIECPTEEDVLILRTIACMAQSHLKDHPPVDDRIIVGRMDDTPVKVLHLEETIKEIIEATI